MSAGLNDPIVGMAATPDGRGYWLVASDGGVFAVGDAGFYGSLGSIHLNQPIVGMAATPDGRGYWLVASDGGVFAVGDAGFYGSLGSIHLNQPIVGMAATPDGRGYWLVASDGGVFAVGDAGFYGSLGSIHLNQPIVGMAATPDGRGYWLVASDGGVFAVGDAGFYGSEGGTTIPGTIVGMAATPDGRGLLDGSPPTAPSMRSATTPYPGSMGGQALTQPIVGMAIMNSTMTVTPPPTTTATTVPPTTTSTTTEADPFVTVCGTQLCLQGQPWYMTGGAAYGSYDDPTGEAGLLTQGNMNTSELVNFDSQYRSINQTEDSTTWDQVEAYIGQMEAAGHHVMLNLSEFFAAMETAGMNPFSPTAGGGTKFQLSGAVPRVRRRPERERRAERGESDHRQGGALGRARDANRRGLHQLTVPGALQSPGHAHLVLDVGGVLALPVAHPHLVRWFLPPQRRQQRLCCRRRNLSVPGWRPVAADHRPAQQCHRRHRRQLDE